jgi:leucyl aminopeptidase
MKTPRVELRRRTTGIHDRDATVVFVHPEDLKKLDPGLARVVGAELTERIATFAAARAYKAGVGEAMYFPTHDSHLTILVGLGASKSYSLEFVRRASANALRLLERMRVASAVFVWPTRLPKRASQVELVSAASEGVLLGAYEFDKYQSSAKNKFSTGLVEFAVDKLSATTKKALQESMLICAAVNEARDMQNDNSDDVNPEHLAKQSKSLAAAHKLTYSVLSGKELSARGLNLLHAVGRASQWPPKLIVLEYWGASKKIAPIAMVGKGITFDTGGVNLKPSAGGQLHEMHLDMSGAAIVMAVLKLAAQLKLRVNLIGALAVAENVIDSNSYKPGSIIRAFNGKTVEVANTDAEGRLVLADAMSYLAATHKPSSIIDVATLTGSIMVTFGYHVAGLVSNNDTLARNLTNASQRTDERLWRLPLIDEYRAETHGKRSDLSNLGSNPRYGDAIVAGAFLEQFTAGIPWAHIDIAGTSMRPVRNYYNPAGGTGFGVRLLVDFLKNLPARKSR